MDTVETIGVETINSPFLVTVDQNKQDEILSYVKKISEDFDKWKKVTEDCSKRLGPVEEKLANLLVTVEAQNKEILALKRASKANNVIIYKMPDNEATNRNLRNTVLDFLGKVNPNITDSTVDSVSRVGKIMGRRPVLVKFFSRQYKSSLFKNLKTVRELNLAIADDLSAEDQLTRKTLSAYLPRLRKLGYKPRLRGQKIVLEDGSTFSAEEIDARLISLESVNENFAPALSPPHLSTSSGFTAINSSYAVKNLTPTQKSSRRKRALGGDEGIRKYMKTQNSSASYESPINAMPQEKDVNT